ncbi:PEGA domain-containing protein [Haliangium ochraceum]|uniref:PEGA domain protein n=1 Tax=Haliangium ochraceum (strain DSM 14365 / JCM 11303 / SMP-2) TaxID=502025 RepID=D0LID1_HALO1|nr:PEGA domain-containing protein [Haliangium ochraceum]ACY16510.1 PEGA domain protein [Haliangium ochraceum DSM 14365]
MRGRRSGGVAGGALFALRTALLALLAWACVAALAPHSACAQRGGKDGEVDAKERAEAELFFRAGEQAYEAGQYLVAAQAFEQAYETLPLPAIAFSTAQAYRLQYFIDKESANLLRSIELYRRYIDSVEQGGRRDDAATSLAELEVIRDRLQRAGRLDPRRRVASDEGRTQLMVTTQVPGAIAKIDDKSGETPLILEVSSGKHQVEVRADGYFSAKQQAVAVSGRLVVVEVELKPQAAKIQLEVEPGATLHIDGRPVAQTPSAEPVSVPAGKRFVAITRRGRRPWTRELELERNASLTIRADLEATTQRSAAIWVLGASALAAVGAGASGVFWYLADAEGADYIASHEELFPADKVALSDIRERRDGRRGITLGLVGAAVAIGAIGGVLYWFDNPHVEQGGRSKGEVWGAEDDEGGASSLRLTPTLDERGAGFAVSGHF